MDLVRGVLGERKQLYLVFTALYKIQLKNNVISVAKKINCNKEKSFYTQENSQRGDAQELTP